jgi:serine/threonine-protein kinase
MSSGGASSHGQSREGGPAQHGSEDPTVFGGEWARRGPAAPPRADRAPAAAPAPAACRRVGGYEILGELGRGGMGVVYKARQVALNRVVALKMILTGVHAGAEELARFRREAEAAACLQHPHIVPIYEVGEADGCPYFSLEYVDGGSLARRLDGRPWRPRAAAELVEVLARAIHAAHRRGVVHRDLKPANVLLTADGTPKIADFGLAKQLGHDSARPRDPLTEFGGPLGTPNYMAPEQARADGRAVGPTTDVYALGAILYELLTGRPPFKAATPVDTVLRLLEEEAAPLRRLNPRVRRGLEAICLKCLEKDPARRYPSAQELADDLRAFLRGEPIRARPPGPWGRLAHRARQLPALTATLLALAVFYTNHLLLWLLDAPGERGTFHLFVTALFLLWAAGAAGFQWLVQRPRGEAVGVFGWAAMDVLFFTAFLAMKDGPSSPLAVGYPLLIAASALRFRPRLVWFVTELCLACYTALVVEARWRRGEVPAPPTTPLMFVLSLLLMGVLMTLLLRRGRAAAAAADEGGGEEG